MKRVLVGLGLVIGAIAVLTVVGVLLFTTTDFGRERVRRFTLSTLREMVHGEVRIGGIGGNLLDGVVMTDFSIADTAGRPFVSADTVIADYKLIAFAITRSRAAPVESPSGFQGVRTMKRPPTTSTSLNATQSPNPGPWSGPSGVVSPGKIDSKFQSSSSSLSKMTSGRTSRRLCSSMRFLANAMSL